MNVTLYTTEEDTRTLGRTYIPVGDTLTADYNANVPISLLEPSIVLDVDTLPVFNYVGIGNRYYFVKDYTRNVDGAWVIYLKEDVLTTYEQAIKNLECVVERQENIFNLYLKDTQLQVTNKTKRDVIKFPNGLTREEGIIVTI